MTRLAAGALAAPMVVLLACGGGDAGELAPSRPAPVLLLGIDGATRTVMDPLMEQGRLPNFAKLRDRGVYAALATREPTISPIIWTSIATGKVPEKHGIPGFTSPIPDTERVTTLQIPLAHQRLSVTLRALLPKQLEAQTMTIEVGGVVRGELELTAEPRETTVDVALDAPTSAITLRFTRSASKQPHSLFYVTARVRVMAACDGGAAVEIAPSRDHVRVFPEREVVDETSYLVAGGPRDIVTVSSNMRRVKALWNIAGERQRKVMVAGFWVTWPAEPVNGVMISSYTSARYGRSKKGSFIKDFPRQTYPETLAADLAPVLEEAIVLGRARAEQAAARFGVKLRPMAAGDLKPVSQMVTAASQSVPQEKDPRDPAEQLVWIATSDSFYQLAAAQLWPTLHPDLSIVYLGEVDVTSHDWWDYEPKLTDGIIAQAYERADAALGKLLAAMGDEAERVNIVVCSDHGFAYDQHGVFEHQFTHPPGILIMAGPDIRHGVDPVDAGVLDIAPTLLTLTGLPVARDMDGRALAEVLKVPVAEPIDTYEVGGPKPPELPIASPIDDKVKDQLRALGYIE